MKTINIHTTGVVHYFHSTCWKDMPEDHVKIFEARMKLINLSLPVYQGFSFNIVKFPVYEHNISFVECPDFDTDTEPVVGKILTVSRHMDGGTYSKIRTYNNHIYHKKYLFVNKFYNGFDFYCDRKYNQNMEIAMNALGIDKRKIGNRKYWESIRTKVLDKSVELTFLT